MWTASIRVDPPKLIGVGLLVAFVTAITPMFLGGNLLESAIVELDLPVLGKVKITSVLILDIGVYLTVVGMSLFLLEQFGGADGRPAPGDELDDAASATDPDAGAADMSGART